MTPFVTLRRRALLQGLLGGAAVIGAGWTPAIAAPAAEVGALAPEFDLSGPAGRVQLSQLHGQCVYLDFWASWCGPCRQSFPWMNEIAQRHAGRGLQVVAINLDAKPADAERFLAELPAHFTVLFDAKGDTPRRFGVKAMPTSLLIGPDGRVLWQHVGFRADDGSALERQITDALASLGHAAERSSPRTPT
ncbi:MAG: TlpA family protein disulfide reductase [Leptothrix sp. (in: b-proteobacteria)]